VGTTRASTNPRRAPVGKFNSPKWRLETLHRGYRRRTGTKNGIESLDLSGVQVTAEDVALLHKQHQKASLVGGSLRDVQALAGHASLATTSRYIATDAEAQRKLVKII